MISIMRRKRIWIKIRLNIMKKDQGRDNGKVGEKGRVRIMPMARVAVRVMVTVLVRVRVR
jgi:hypothetical protein